MEEEGTAYLVLWMGGLNLDPTKIHSPITVPIHYAVGRAVCDQTIPSSYTAVRIFYGFHRLLGLIDTKKTTTTTTATLQAVCTWCVYACHLLLPAFFGLSVSSEAARPTHNSVEKWRVKTERKKNNNKAGCRQRRRGKSFFKPAGGQLCTLHQPTSPASRTRPTPKQTRIEDGVVERDGNWARHDQEEEGLDSTRSNAVSFRAILCCVCFGWWIFRLRREKDEEMHVLHPAAQGERNVAESTRHNRVVFVQNRAIIRQGK